MLFRGKSKSLPSVLHGFRIRTFIPAGENLLDAMLLDANERFRFRSCTALKHLTCNCFVTVLRF